MTDEAAQLAARLTRIRTFSFQILRRDDDVVQTHSDVLWLCDLAERLRQERDAARAEHVTEHEQTRAFWINRHGMQVERAEAAEARVKTLEAALGIEIRERQRLATENSVLRGEAQIGL